MFSNCWTSLEVVWSPPQDRWRCCRRTPRGWSWSPSWSWCGQWGTPQSWPALPCLNRSEHKAHRVTCWEGRHILPRTLVMTLPTRRLGWMTYKACPKAELALKFWWCFSPEFLLCCFYRTFCNSKVWCGAAKESVWWRRTSVVFLTECRAPSLCTGILIQN